MHTGDRLVAEQGAGADGGRALPHLPRRLREAGAAAVSAHLLRELRDDVVRPRADMSTLPVEDRRRSIMARRLHHLLPAALLRIPPHIGSRLF